MNSYESSDLQRVKDKIKEFNDDFYSKCNFSWCNSGRLIEIETPYKVKWGDRVSIYCNIGINDDFLFTDDGFLMNVLDEIEIDYFINDPLKIHIKKHQDFAKNFSCYLHVIARIAKSIYENDEATFLPEDTDQSERAKLYRLKLRLKYLDEEHSILKKEHEQLLKKCYELQESYKDYHNLLNNYRELQEANRHLVCSRTDLHKQIQLKNRKINELEETVRNSLKIQKDLRSEIQYKNIEVSTLEEGCWYCLANNRHAGNQLEMLNKKIKKIITESPSNTKDKSLYRIKPLSNRRLYVEFKGNPRKEGVISYHLIPMLNSIDLDQDDFNSAYIEPDSGRVVWKQYWDTNISYIKVTPNQLWDALFKRK